MLLQRGLEMFLLLSEHAQLNPVAFPHSPGLRMKGLRLFHIALNISTRWIKVFKFDYIIDKNVFIERELPKFAITGVSALPTPCPILQYVHTTCLQFFVRDAVFDDNILF